tara:strand:+ start:296 stop:727 length:432 start_codon:yes stop_codon:yes gene_type:complete
MMGGYVNQEAVLEDGTWLQCPICNGPNLHQGSVGVYHLGTPSEYLLEHQVIVDTTTQEVNDGYIPLGTGMNPSSRRQGMRIAFECEVECDVPDLIIYQHKGTTVIGWDDVSMLPKETVFDADNGPYASTVAKENGTIPKREIP